MEKTMNNKSNNATKIAVIAALIVAVVVGVLYGCVPSYNAEEILAAAKELIEASYEINTIFFGEGLPTIGYDEDSDDTLGDSYAALSEDSPYKSESEIKEAALKVYTEEYCSFLFEKAFLGQKVEFVENDEDELPEIVQIPARYLTYEGVLVVRKVDDDERIKLNRTYDTENVRVVKKYRTKVIVGVQAFEDGVPTEEETFVLEYTPSGWRLDDPTY